MENRGRILIDVNLGGDESTRCCDQCQVGKAMVTERCSWWRCRWSSTTSQLSRVLLRLAGASQQGQPHSEAPQAPQMPHRALNHCHHIKKPQEQKPRKMSSREIYPVENLNRRSASDDDICTFAHSALS